VPDVAYRVSFRLSEALLCVHPHEMFGAACRWLGSHSLAMWKPQRRKKVEAIIVSAAFFQISCAAPGPHESFGPRSIPDYQPVLAFS
jgi:hypothetical protein